MSRTSALVASAAVALMVLVGPAPAFAQDLAPAPAGPVLVAPGPGTPGGGDAQPTAVWTWVCQLFGGCK